jgi:hypothetical protein
MVVEHDAARVTVGRVDVLLSVSQGH